MDNTPSDYAAEAVEWAVQAGILQGSQTGDLMLNQPVTRQQLAVILHRFAKLRGELSPLQGAAPNETVQKICIIRQASAHLNTGVIA